MELQTIVEIFEIFSLVTGIIYMVLEVLQRNFMWVVGILTAVAAVAVFGMQGLYASMGLNVYYVAVSVKGLIQWKSDSSSSSGIHLRKPQKGFLLWSAGIMLVGTALLAEILALTGDPAPLFDAAVTMLSAIATWWLALSVPEQWLLWIVADLASAVLCYTQGMNWMTVLYALYVLSAAFGYFHWKRKGEYVHTED